MADYVQLKNPKTGLYTKIDKEKGVIVSHKKTKGPYKGVPIADHPIEDVEKVVIDEEIYEVEEEVEEDPVEDFLDEFAKEEPEAAEEGEEEIEIIKDDTEESDLPPTPPPRGIKKTFFDFTYYCDHGTPQHCKMCYQKARIASRG